MSQLRVVPLGGMGKVTLNMFLYEYENEILIIDSGIGFPDVYQPGVDTIIPDISYLLNKIDQGKKIVGLVLTHGHEDHIGALGYLLPDLPDFPIWGSELTIGFTNKRLSEKKIERHIQLIKDGNPVDIGEHFSVTSLAMTHSIPDTKHLILRTPEGIIYHGSDFKLDKNPVDGVLPDYEAVTNVGNEGILLALTDCLRVEKSQWVESESAVGPELDSLMSSTHGKFIVTLMSSHIHRIQQVVNAAEKQGRKIAFIGRSIEQNIKVALELNKLHISKGVMINKRKIDQYPDEEMCIMIAGSQGQEGSSMMRAVYGEHRAIQINPRDKVVFSADAIPGNEIPYFNAVDELCRNEVDVIYPDVNENVHQSGHASAAEQQELLSLLKPQYTMPIGGADRHRFKFRETVAKNLGYKDDKVLLPNTGEILGIEHGKIKVVETIVLRPKIIDGLGIGDVGPVVLSDRLSLSQAGIVAIMLPRFEGQFDLSKMTVVSRGFVFMKQADEVISFIKENTAMIIEDLGNVGDEQLRKTIEKRLSRKLYKAIRREPLIVAAIMDL